MRDSVMNLPIADLARNRVRAIVAAGQSHTG
jgi:hypothetical protein